MENMSLLMYSFCWQSDHVLHWPSLEEQSFYFCWSIFSYVSHSFISIMIIEYMILTTIYCYYPDVYWCLSSKCIWHFWHCSCWNNQLSSFCNWNSFNLCHSFNVTSSFSFWSINWGQLDLLRFLYMQQSKVGC